MRHVEPVVAAEAEEEVVARDAGDGLRLEAEQLSDPVVLVDDVVAGAQVGERLQRAAGSGDPRARAAAEDLRVGQERQPQVAPHEAAARGRDREQELGFVRQRLARLEQARVDAPQEVQRAERLAAVREGDDDAVLGAQQCRELVLRLREPARRDRRPLRLEGELLTVRQRLQLGCAFEARRCAVHLFFPDLAHLVGLPDEVGRPVERRDQIAGDGRQLVVVGQRRLDEVQPPLDGGIDDRAVDVVQRALRERREDA